MLNWHIFRWPSLNPINANYSHQGKVNFPTLTMAVRKRTIKVKKKKIYIYLISYLYFYLYCRGGKIIFPSTLLGSWLRHPCNKRQINR